MALNQKAIKVLGKVFEAGFTDEKSIAAMTMDDILAIQGITIADIGIINKLQKSMIPPPFTLGGVTAFQKSMPPKDRQDLTEKSSVCCMNTHSSVAVIKALTVIAMRLKVLLLTPSIKNIPTKLTTNTNRWTKRIRTAYGTSRQKRRRNIEPLSVKCVTKCTLRLPSDAASMTVNTKTEI